METSEGQVAAPPQKPSKWDMMPEDQHQFAHAVIALAPLLAEEELEKYADILDGESTELLSTRVAAWRDRNDR